MGAWVGVAGKVVSKWPKNREAVTSEDFGSCYKQARGLSFSCQDHKLWQSAYLAESPVWSFAINRKGVTTWKLHLNPTTERTLGKRQRL